MKLPKHDKPTNGGGEELHNHDKPIKNDKPTKDDTPTKVTKVQLPNHDKQIKVSALKCMYTNADSLLNKRAELLTNIEALKPDVVAVTEVLPKCGSENVQEVELEIQDFDCFKLLKESGVCIYVRKYLKAIQVDDLVNSQFSESMWCEVKLKGNDKILIGCIYRSPNSSNSNGVYLSDLIKDACNRRNSHLLIMGDFNYSEIDWKSWTSSAAESHGSSILLNTLQDNFLYQLVDQNTRFRHGQQPSLLDLILVNDDAMIGEIMYGAALGKSDHIVLSFDLMCYIDATDGNSTERFLYHKGEYVKMKEDLAKINWDKDLANLDMNSAWKCFNNHMKQAMEDNIPKIKPCNPTRTEKKQKPMWMSSKALKAVKKKYHSWKRYTWTRQYQDYLKYIQARNAATKDIRGAKRNFEKKLAADIKTNPKSFWKYVRSKTKVKAGISDLEKGDGSYAHTDSEKAEVLNEFFSSVFTREDLKDIPEPRSRNKEDILEDILITDEDVLKKLQKLNPTKSPGPDGLHPRVLKEAANEISQPLATIFNISMKEGRVPEDWKIAHVTAIFKKGKKTTPGNYRPVSLTSIICKLMESIIRDKLMEFIDERDLLSDDQHGFRSGRSCVTQLLEIVEIWSSMLDEGGGIDVVYLDFRKAFDSVPHERLLKKVKSYGIQGNLLCWIRSFLTGRKQRVIVNGGESSWLEVLSGIPQGSVLGPILFLLFIDDLPESVEGLVKIFADDTKVFTAVHEESDCKRLQKDLDYLSDWSDRWQLRFNISKCGVMHYGNQNEKFTYNMQEEGVKRNLVETKED